MNQKSYDGSHILLAGIELVAWLCVVSGAIMGFVSIDNPKAILPSSIWFAFGFSAVGLAAMARVGRAIVDIAENTGRTAQLLAVQPDRGKTPTQNDVAPHPDAPRSEPQTTGGWPLGQVEIYRGHVITGLQNRVFANDRYFDSVDAARRHLNSVPAKQA
jgi:hypothetical protein